MNELHPTEYKERLESVPPFQIHITSYKINNTFYCSVDDVDPGAIIARSQGLTREEAELKATVRAKDRLLYSRVRYKKRILVQQRIIDHDLENEN